jgi:hypothetical protein|tara:strand:+ start:265 stop:582 length:318 start_codon:yes stop_codon:yes gene_type:complete
MENKVKIGDIFKCSWGYDQTNVDFFKCVGFTPCFMKYIKVDTVIADFGDHGADKVVPGNKEGNTVYKAKIKNSYCGDPGFAPNTYSWAGKWDGVPTYQTAAGWGH